MENGKSFLWDPARFLLVQGGHISFYKLHSLFIWDLKEPDKIYSRLATASEDDLSPIIMMLPRRPVSFQRIPVVWLTFAIDSYQTQKACLVAVMVQSHLVLEPQTLSLSGFLPDWAFQVDWCLHNPDLLATDLFDRTIGMHFIQTTNEETTETIRNPAACVRNPSCLTMKEAVELLCIEKYAL
ncbi:hypothetical protein C8J56DRAFT_879876 [Mycena floridula]|nr:hypothetical protein C8J56DRAFT_879876 [Mycena floridula]